VRRGEIWTISDTEAVLLIGSDQLHENDFPITYGLPLRAEPPEGIEHPFVVRLSRSATGLDVENWAHTYAMRTIRVTQLRTRLGSVAGRSIAAVDEALRTLWQL
jgi:hypothetical protein